ncbi:hypothetical protein MUP05_03635 [Candidatus Bathyarchaeota archaeon]|nr:hypothetical protein [Candidatus Bathyarchaeota archaeon]
MTNSERKYTRRSAEEIESIRKLHMDGHTAVSIHNATGIPRSTVSAILNRLGAKAIRPIKEATQAQIKDEQAIQEIQGAVRDSLQTRKKTLAVLEGIRDREPVKIQTEKGEITLDEAPLKVKTALAINELQNSLDEMLGIRDVATIKEVMRQREEIARIRKLAEGRAQGDNRT